MMKKIRTAVIGCGYFGSMHAEIYASASGADLIAVVDRDDEKAGDLAKRLLCRPYGSLGAALSSEEIDLVDVCLPDSLHTDAVLQAMAADKHIFIEKPLADTLDNARRLMMAAVDYPRKITVGHICRFDIRYVKAREAIQSGALGDIIYIASKRNSPVLGARRYARHCKLLTHSGVHDLDLVRWFLGSEYQQVYAASRRVRMIHEGYPDTDDAVLAVFTLDNGVTYSLENCWALPDQFPSYIDAKMNIVGTRGAIQIDFADQGYQFAGNSHYELPDIAYWPEVNGLRSGDLRLELEDFIECIQQDRQPRVTVRDGYEVALAAVKAMESAAIGQVVTLR